MKSAEFVDESDSGPSQVNGAASSTGKRGREDSGNDSVSLHLLSLFLFHVFKNDPGVIVGRDGNRRRGDHCGTPKCNGRLFECREQPECEVHARVYFIYPLLVLSDFFQSSGGSRTSSDVLKTLTFKRTNDRPLKKPRTLSLPSEPNGQFSFFFFVYFLTGVCTYRNAATYQYPTGVHPSGGEFALAFTARGRVTCPSDCSTVHSSAGYRLIQPSQV